MKVLIIHNTYKFNGGEDSLVFAEKKLLESAGNNVKLILFNNDKFNKNPLILIKDTIYNRNSFDQVKDLIVSFEPDVVHVHNLFYSASPAVIYAVNSMNIPIVMTIHNYRLVCNAATLLKGGQICEKCLKQTFPIYGILDKCFQNSIVKSAQLTLITGLHKLQGTWKGRISRYIFLTEFAKQKLLNSSLNLSRQQCVVKPNFVSETGNFEGSERTGNFLFVGRLSIEKGILVLLEAFKKLNYNIDIIGTGPLEAEVKRFCSTYKNISYFGAIASSNVMMHMKKCRALIFPSIWYEGMPMTILEAYSCGTPVISSDVDNINSIVINGKSGLHFKTGCPDSLGEAVRRIETMDTEHLYVGARKEYEEKYTPEKNLKMLTDIYTSVIEEHSAKQHKLIRG